MHSRALADPRNFPWIGDPELEGQNLSPTFLTPDVLTYDLDFVWPQCQIRRSYAIELAMTSLSFLFLHEIMHLRNGHINYKAQLKKDGGKIDTITNQALELDADNGACIYLFRGSLNNANYIDTIHDKMSPHQQSIYALTYAHDRLLIRTISYAVYFMFRLYNSPLWNSQIQDRIPHPLPPVRARNFRDTLMNAFANESMPESNRNIAFTEVGTIFDIALQDAEVACANIQDELSIPAVNNTNPQVMAISKYSEELLTKLKEIKPRLERHRRS